MTNKTTADQLLDSAMWIAAATGICYATGFLAHRRPTWEFGIPWYFLPEIPLHQALVVGAVYLLFYITLALVVYILYVNAKNRFTSLVGIEHYFKLRFENHRIAYPAFLGVIAAATLALVPMYVYSPFGDGLLQTRHPLRVIELERENQAAIEDLESWSYLSRSNGIIVLGQTGTRRYIMINEGNVKRIVLDTPTDRPRRASNK